ncbi:M23 family metallopeptidase [Paenibacillus camelliae]|uniref:M23 family metallopeptidase n=1 Tax=Paenibacillus camelliae TaxID=512410 RepID=UPI00255A1E2F|nr:M23 family metallopeptidase [Paenibacillus camelliae]
MVNAKPLSERMIDVTGLRYVMSVLLIAIFLLPAYAYTSPYTAAEKKKPRSTEEIFTERLELYNNLSVMTGMSWEWIAAIDQYERTMTKAKPKLRPQLGDLTGVYIDEYRWAGTFNPDPSDEQLFSIEFFQGIGKDGNGDGLASRSDDTDLLYTILHLVSQHGITDEDIAIGLWEYYQNPRAVQRIQQFHQLYSEHEKLNLFEHAFPLPIGNNYSYRDTWGDRRGWGGRRIHEGTDIFAGHGTPVRSTCYGVIEIKGWNRYGGWRVGIRDLNSHYHYYAHLSGFTKELAIGQTVKPGEVIGWVGSSGYGKPGTSGKFPPHLHYGIYSDRGFIEWAFDPYPSLKHWENEERRRLRK